MWQHMGHIPSLYLYYYLEARESCTGESMTPPPSSSHPPCPRHRPRSHPRCPRHSCPPSILLPCHHLRPLPSSPALHLCTPVLSACRDCLRYPHDASAILARPRSTHAALARHARQPRSAWRARIRAHLRSTHRDHFSRCKKVTASTSCLLRPSDAHRPSDEPRSCFTLS
jgi:hypothetical protein